MAKNTLADFPTVKIDAIKKSYRGRLHDIYIIRFRGIPAPGIARREVGTGQCFVETN